MKKKHYPVVAAGIKAAVTIDLVWDVAILSVKVSHRKGQKVDIDFVSEYHSYLDHYQEYTVLRVTVPTKDFPSDTHAIAYIRSRIKSITKYVNFEAADDLVTKELCTALNKG